MPGIDDGSYDCIYCSGVLEHVDNFQAGFREITKVLKSGGTFLLGLPFRQAAHTRRQDFWRFTECGITTLLKQGYDVEAITPIDPIEGADFTAAYWVKTITRHAT